MVIQSAALTEEQLKELAFTKEEREMQEEARRMPITFDEDCPPTTPEKALRFRRVNPRRGESESNGVTKES